MASNLFLYFICLIILCGGVCAAIYFGSPYKHQLDNLKTGQQEIESINNEQDDRIRYLNSILNSGTGLQNQVLAEILANEDASTLLDGFISDETGDYDNFILGINGQKGNIDKTIKDVTDSCNTNLAEFNKDNKDQASYNNDLIGPIAINGDDILAFGTAITLFKTKPYLIASLDTGLMTALQIAAPGAVVQFKSVLMADKISVNAGWISLPSGYTYLLYCNLYCNDASLPASVTYSFHVNNEYVRGSLGIFSKTEDTASQMIVPAYAVLNKIEHLRVVQVFINNLSDNLGCTLNNNSCLIIYAI